MAQTEGYFLFGAPATGKGEQSDRLEKRHGLVAIVTRRLIKAKSAVDPAFKAMADPIIASGNFLDDTVIHGLIMEAIGKLPSFVPPVFDGACRTVFQARLLREELLSFRCGYRPVILHIDTPFELCLERMKKRAEKEGRTDDNEEVFRERYDLYLRETMPVLDFFSLYTEIVKIDGTRDIEGVYAQISQYIHAPMRTA